MFKFKPCELRGFNNYDVAAASNEAATINDEPSMTQQHFRDDCDINVIVERFGLTGELPSNVRAPMYGDFTGVSDYQSALHAIMEAEDSFMQMDPKVRLRFENDPQKFVDFCSDAGNIEAMREMGLAVPKEKSREPVSVRVVGEAVGVQASASGGGDRGDAGAAGGSKGVGQSGGKAGSVG